MSAIADYVLQLLSVVLYSPSMTELVGVLLVLAARHNPK